MMPNIPGYTGDNTQKDDLGLILKLISFILPMVGIIIYFVTRKPRPNSARQAAIAAAFGVAVEIMINVIYSALIKITR